MNTVVFKSKSKTKLDLLIKLAKQMGISTQSNGQLTDEDMAMPGPKVSNEQVEEWLAKGDGDEEYTAEQMRGFVKKQLSETARKK